ncbi:MAG: hypothetical protein JO316_01730 [Abitibacteriaceae bacterium]|nr:hypothetical protein [Abditibacteriaceae bacterium]
MSPVASPRIVSRKIIAPAAWLWLLVAVAASLLAFSEPARAGWKIDSVTLNGSSSSPCTDLPACTNGFTHPWEPGWVDNEGTYANVALSGSQTGQTNEGTVTTHLKWDDGTNSGGYPGGGGYPGSVPTPIPVPS